ncbi:hypothetical protein NODU109028_13595 [Nocardioides dubius]|uniref:DUF4244 domain-containing protein n=1 Tax=Nocardioides dubius TaxID=317019 RepID=A0ABN1TJW3_9ACTN
MRRCRRCWSRAGRGRDVDERGDVPAWVMLAVMTAGIVAGLWEFAGGELQAMLRDALASVRG